jgi:hypothetical protein
MISPCPKCGATKTDPVPRDFKYNLARAFGYRLQRCSRCRTARFIRIHRGRSLGESLIVDETGSSGWLVEEGESPATAEARPEPGKDQVAAADPSDCDVSHCPDCGSRSYHRTRRTTAERMLRRPPMARCESCGTRFPYPRHHEEHPEQLDLAGAGEPHPAGEENVPRMASENTQSEVPKQVAGTDSSDSDMPRCPACGSTKRHRTQRTTLERVLERPPMARCERCGTRFPYLMDHAKSSDPLKSGEAVASLSHKGEEGVGSSTGEEIAGPEDVKQGRAAHSSGRESSCCPFCGSTVYRRSRRKTLERLLLRPKMARCSRCRKRFPFPER